MISDVLSECSDHIKRYQNEMPDIYESEIKSLDALTYIMDVVTKALDSPRHEGPLLTPETLMVAIHMLDETWDWPDEK